MFFYSCFDPYAHEYLRFRSASPPVVYLPEQYNHWPIVPLSAIVSVLPDDAQFVGIFDDPKGIICSLNQYQKALDIQKRSQMQETSILDLALITGSVFTVLSFFGKFKW